ncbi:MAG: PhoX family phosphatase [Pseudomonadota bacterium]
MPDHKTPAATGLTPAPRAAAAEASEDQPTNTSANPTMGEVVANRFSRRDIGRGALAVTAIGALASLPGSTPPAGAQDGTTGPAASATQASSRFVFEEVKAGSDADHHVADGYDADVLIRWGDPVLPNAPAFEPSKPDAQAQARQFGYNNDFVGFIALQNDGARGLLVVNHEFTNEELMFPGLGVTRAKDRFAGMTADLIAVEMMAHGGSVIEIAKREGGWHVVEGSRYARRITAETAMAITGPAAGHKRMMTGADPTGRNVKGMINNCAGGVTPWGTWLTCEENFNGYFWGKSERASHPEAAALKRYGAPAEWYGWGLHHARFDITREPQEINRFGWVVEIDPFDPTSIPKKRTALGRFKHEGAANIVNRDGRFVVYQGDDQRFDYVYKFITAGKVNTDDRAANMDLLDEGTLYVARFDPDGTGRWLPLVHGEGPLTAANGFADQGDVVISARLAADALGATKMDRPEDVEANPQTNKVYVLLTNNTRRSPLGTDAANPRGPNFFGHIIEMMPEGGDHAAETFTWTILVKCGDPSLGLVGATFNPATTENGWFGMPDNCAIDAEGRLWIATDGNSPARTGRADGVWSLETEGPLRGTSKLFYRVPNGAEMCGPAFTPDMETLFVAVQHPGVGLKRSDPPATFEKPTTRWPDFDDAMPPRPAVVAITKKGGGKIGMA